MGQLKVDAHRPDEFRAGDHTYWKNGRRVPGFTEIATAQGMIDFSRVPQHALSRAMHVGTAVHLATAYFDRGNLDMATISDEIRPYLEAYKDFRESTGFEPIEIEEPVMNIDYGYACTPDRVGTFRGHRSKLAIVELKKSAIMPWHPCQVEAQAICFKGNPLKKIIQLRPDGRWKPVPEDKARASYYRGLWLSAVSLYHFNHQTEETLWRRQAA